MGFSLQNRIGLFFLRLDTSRFDLFSEDGMVRPQNHLLLVHQSIEIHCIWFRVHSHRFDYLTINLFPTQIAFICKEILSLKEQILLLNRVSNQYFSIPFCFLVGYIIHGLIVVNNLHRRQYSEMNAINFFYACSIFEHLGLRILASPYKLHSIKF